METSYSFYEAPIDILALYFSLHFIVNLQTFSHFLPVLPPNFAVE